VVGFSFLVSGCLFSRFTGIVHVVSRDVGFPSLLVLLKLSSPLYVARVDRGSVVIPCHFYLNREWRPFFIGVRPLGFILCVPPPARANPGFFPALPYFTTYGSVYYFYSCLSIFTCPWCWLPSLHDLIWIPYPDWVCDGVT